MSRQTISDGLKRAGVKIGNGTRKEIQRRAEKKILEAAEAEKEKYNLLSSSSQFLIQENANAVTGEIVNKLQ